MRIAVTLLLLMFAACSRQGDILFVDPALLSMVPADSVVLAGIKMEKIRETAAFRKYAASPSFKQPLDNFEKETGIDPRKDLWEILISSNGKGKSLVFGRGTFSGMGLEPNIEKPGIERANYKGYMLFVKDDSGVVFLNSSTIAAGKTALLRHAFPHAAYVLLEDPEILTRLRADPRAFIEALEPPVILDEM